MFVPSLQKKRMPLFTNRNKCVHNDITNNKKKFQEGSHKLQKNTREMQNKLFEEKQRLE